MSHGGSVLRFHPDLPREQSLPRLPRDRPALHERMNSLVCRCCGEPMPEKGNALSRNPNICASCSSMTDGMDESGMPQKASPAPEAKEAVARERLGAKAVDPEIHHIPT
jgi:hypothetical protein